MLVPKAYAQSFILLLDLLMALLFYLVYRKDVKKINNDKRIVENDLLESYQYIGKINREVELFEQFINFLASNDDLTSKNGKKNIFKALLINILVSVVKANKGFLRFIDVATEKTISEFYYHEAGDQFIFKLSNSELLDDRFNNSASRNGIKIFESDYHNTKIRCILCYAAKDENEKEKVDIKFLKSLLNQIHLLFLVTSSRPFIVS